MRANSLWWASLDHSSPRYRDWYGILNDDRVPLLSPFSTHAQLGEEKDVEVYGLDWQNLDGEQSDRLLNFIAHKFGVTQEEVAKDLDRDGLFPIRAADVTVFYSLRAFL